MSSVKIDEEANEAKVVYVWDGLKVVNISEEEIASAKLLPFDSSKKHYSTIKIAHELGISPQQVRALKRKRVLNFEHKNHEHCWELSTDELDVIRDGKDRSLESTKSGGDTGLLEVSIGLTSAATTIMALLPGSEAIPNNDKDALQFVAFVIALASLYVSLCFLGEYVEDKGLIEVKQGEVDTFGLGHFGAMLLGFSAGPYWILAWALVFLVGAIAIISHV